MNPATKPNKLFPRSLDVFEWCLSAPAVSFAMKTLSLIQAVSLLGVGVVAVAGRATAQPRGATFRLSIGEAHALRLPADSAGRRVQAADVLLLSESRLAALDLRYDRVVLAESGPGGTRTVASIPLPEHSPRARLMYDGSRVMVLGTATGVAWPIPLTDQHPTPGRRLTFGFPFSDACGTPSEITVVGLHNGRTVHRFGPRGDPLGSSGTPLAASLTAQRVAASVQGMSLCHGSRVIVASSILPEVRALGTGGRAVWTWAVPDFAGVKPVETSDGKTRFDHPPGGPDGILELFAPAKEVVAVQVWRSRAPDVVETWFLDASTGRVLGRQDDLPRIRQAVGGTTLLAVRRGNPSLQLIPYTASER